MANGIEKVQTGQSRHISFDILRIIAALSVVMIHVTSYYFECCSVSDNEFAAANFIDSVNRYGVPIFVMISGALFLDGNRSSDIKRLWLHNILRIVIIYFVQGFAYYVYQSVYLWNFDFWHYGPLRTLTGIVYSTNHLWFLGMIAGLYILSPVIKKWVNNADRKNIEYFLMVFIVFQILNTTLSVLLDSSLYDKFANEFRIVEVSRYLGYFVLGYYLMNYELPKKLRIVIYATVPADIFANYFISYLMTKNEGSYNPGVYDCFGLFTFLEVAALFMAVKTLDGKIVSGIKGKILTGVSNDTFGVYLIHVMILDFIFRNNVFEKLSNPWIWAYPIGIGVFILSMLISAVLRRIPFIGRYIC